MNYVLFVHEIKCCRCCCFCWHCTAAKTTKATHTPEINSTCSHTHTRTHTLVHTHVLRFVTSRDKTNKTRENRRQLHLVGLATGKLRAKNRAVGDRKREREGSVDKVWGRERVSKSGSKQDIEIIELAASCTLRIGCVDKKCERERLSKLRRVQSSERER